MDAWLQDALSDVLAISVEQAGTDLVISQEKASADPSELTTNFIGTAVRIAGLSLRAMKTKAG